MSRPRIALAGNPNTGKTTLFNRLTGSDARVGNYPGVTVELAVGQVDLGKGAGVADVVDVPGTYSLVARSREEQVAIECVLGLGRTPVPDLVVCCVDATNLPRNLYFVLQAQELGLNLLVALTMTDEAGPAQMPAQQLASLLGCPVIPVLARTGEGIAALKEKMAARLGAKAQPMFRFALGDGLRAKVEHVKRACPPNLPNVEAFALWALMSVTRDDELELSPELRNAVLEVVPDDEAGAELDREVVCARYAWIDAHVSPHLGAPVKRTGTERADAILIHPVWGFLSFLLISLVIFQSLFSWSAPAISAIEWLFGKLGEQVAGILGKGLLTDLVVEGVIGGAGSVVVFLPQILLLFFFVGLMEDSGYMARVAYLMDRVMKSMGLHGRAFVPMLSGFACAVPAIMATRTMERQRDRFLTMMVVPLMTCSARLPVYTLIIGALFPAEAAWLGIPLQGGLLVGMYLFSVAVALVAAWVLSKTVLRAESSALILELPPYRLPHARDVLRMMLQRARVFLTQAGTIILVCSVLLWGLLNFPRDAQTAQASIGAEHEKTAQLSHSYGGQLGRALEPVIEPLGFDWKIGVGLIGAFAAREVFVATMGVVYAAGGEVDENDATLREKLRDERKADGSRAYTPLVGFSLLVFFALACQCMSTLAVVKRETHGFRWPVFLFVYMTSLAWVVSFAVYQGGRLLGLG